MKCLFLVIGFFIACISLNEFSKTNESQYLLFTVLACCFMYFNLFMSEKASKNNA